MGWVYPQYRELIDPGTYVWLFAIRNPIGNGIGSRCCFCFWGGNIPSILVFFLPKNRERLWFIEMDAIDMMVGKSGFLWIEAIWGYPSFFLSKMCILQEKNVIPPGKKIQNKTMPFPIGSMAMVYLTTVHLVDFYGTCIRKYTVRPMDPMGSSKVCKIFTFQNSWTSIKHLRRWFHHDLIPIMRFVCLLQSSQNLWGQWKVAVFVWKVNTIGDTTIFHWTMIMGG